MLGDRQHLPLASGCAARPACQDVAIHLAGTVAKIPMTDTRMVDVTPRPDELPIGSGGT